MTLLVLVLPPHTHIPKFVYFTMLLYTSLIQSSFSSRSRVNTGSRAISAEEVRILNYKSMLAMFNLFDRGEDLPKVQEYFTVRQAYLIPPVPSR